MSVAPKGNLSEPEVNCQRFRGGYYNNPGHFANKINAFLRKISANVQIVYSSIQSRCEYQYHLRFPPRHIHYGRNTQGMDFVR